MKAIAQTASRDLRSMTLLGQCAVGLGDPIPLLGLKVSGLIQSVNASGQMPFTFQSRGITETRLAIATTSGNEIHTSSGRHGQVQLANGSVFPKPDASVRYAWPQLLPAFLCAWPLADPTFSIQYVETTNVFGSPADHLRISANVLNGDGTSDDIEALLSRLDLYLDATSHLPLQMTTKAFGATGIQNSIAIDTYYSAYSQFQGITYPATITEYAAGSINRIITVKSLSTNQSFQDTDFVVGQAR